MTANQRGPTSDWSILFVGIIARYDLHGEIQTKFDLCGEIQTRIVLNDEIFEILLNFLAVIKFLSSQTCLGQ